MGSRFSDSELTQLKEALQLINKYKFSDLFGDISGSLQKVIDIIEISSSQKSGENYNFICPEKVPHIKGSQHLVPIINSIKSKKAIRIYYQPFYEDKPYFSDVHPYLLKEYKSRWYMIGLNDFKDQIRTYSLDRIKDIEESNVSYIETKINVSSYFKSSIGIISPEGPPPLIKIAVQKTQAQYMITQPWHESQNIESEDEDEVFFTFKVHPTYEFISLLLSFGKDVRVIEPESVKEKIKIQLEEALKGYL